MTAQEGDLWRSRRSSDLTLQNTSLNFGIVAVGDSKALTTTLVNNSASSVAITRAVATEPDFKIESPGLPLTLAAGQSASVKVSFNPKANGMYTGHLIMGSDNTYESAVASLSGSSGATGATSQLTVSPTSVNFGNVQVGVNQTQPVILTNSGSAGLTISQASVTGTGFKLSGMTVPMALSAGQSVRCNVTFAPQTGGSASGSLSIQVNSSTTGSTGSWDDGWRHHRWSPSTTVPLTGTGVAAQAGALAANPSSVSFGSVPAGSHNNLSETLTNTGSSSVTITQANVTGSTFSVNGLQLPVSLNAGQSASFTVSFAPAGTGTASGNLAIVSNASNSMLNIGLSGTVAGTAAALNANPSSLSFGSVSMGSTKSLSTSVTNSGGTSATISRIAASGTGYSVSSLTSPVTLGTGQSYTFNVTFAPTASSSSTGSVSVTSDASNPTLSIPLSGSAAALGTLAVTPSSINFGNVAVGTTQSQPATLSAGTAPVTISSASVNNSEFTVSGLTLPLTLPAGGTASFSVMFKPQASGAASANISFASNATTTPTVEAVSGSGTVSAQAHSVALSWNSSSTASGYNVYRGAVSGGPYAKINSALDAGASYTDASVQGGQTYYYVVTAVDGSGTESPYSNQVQAVVPSP